MSLGLDSRVGGEDLQLAMFETVTAGLQPYIDAEEASGILLDTRIATAAGVDPRATKLEAFVKFHYGHRPSMIEAPVDEYPSMSVNTYMAGPAATNVNTDYGHSLSLRLALEFIVKAGPYPEDDRSGVGEDLVGRRAKRTTEAINSLVSDHQSLGGHFMPPEIAPNITYGEIFQRVEDGQTATGPRWYWQGVRIEYIYLKQTVFSN